MQTALVAVQTHPRHDLNLGFRQSIFFHIGPQLQFKAHRVRTHLAILTIEKVLPIWNAVLGPNDLPYRAINIAKDVLSKNLSVEAASRERDSLWTECDDLAYEHSELQIAVGVGYGATQAIATAVHDECFDSETNFEITDEDVDAEDLDPSFFGAAASANGTVWDDDSNSNNRRVFWEWWITEAIPSAWEKR